MQKLTCALAALLFGCTAFENPDNFDDDNTGATESDEDAADMGTGEDCGATGQQVSCPCGGGLPDGVQVCQADGSFSECMGCEAGDDDDDDNIPDVMPDMMGDGDGVLAAQPGVQLGQGVHAMDGRAFLKIEDIMIARRPVAT